MKICIFGTAWFDDYYSRNPGICKALSQTGHEIEMCTFAGLYRGLKWRKIFWLIETPIRWLILFSGIRKIRHADILYLPYPAFIDIWPALLLKHTLGIRIYLDVFIGLYDSIIRDRQLTTRSIPGKLIFMYERFILGSVDRCYIDTIFHKKMLVDDYRLPGDKVFVIPNPIAEDIWSAPGTCDDKSGVIFWGTYIPLHGIETIIGAARILQDRGSPIKLRLVGSGQELVKMQNLASDMGLMNIDFVADFIPMPELKALADQAICVLGIFSASDKADRVIPYKIAQALCASLPVITASTSATRDLVGDTEALYLVAPDNADALADAIIDVCNNEEKRNALSRSGRHIFDTCLSGKAIQSLVAKAFG